MFPLYTETGKRRNLYEKEKTSVSVIKAILKQENMLKVEKFKKDAQKRLAKNMTKKGLKRSKDSRVFNVNLYMTHIYYMLKTIIGSRGV